MENEKDKIEKFNPYLNNSGNKKHFFDDILKPILSGLGGMILVGLFVLGEYHSCSKHKDDSELMIYTPLALYRGVEFFWHNDFAGVNWDRRLKDDSIACLFFLSYSNDKTTNPLELNRKIEKFSAEITKYPKDKLDVLKTVSKLYSELIFTMISDFGNAIKNYYLYGQKHLSYSGKIVEIEKKLKDYLPADRFDEFINPAKIAYENLKEKLEQNGFEEGERDKFLYEYDNLANSMKITFGVAYKKLFNEDM